MSRSRTESSGDSACPVCHENAEIFAIGPCDHPICYRCSTRMRVLCGQTYCPICRGELPQIVFLTSRQKYDEVERRSCIPNRKYKILLEDETVEDAFEALLEHRCPVCDHRPLFDSFQNLRIHMNRTHTLFSCDLCVSHLKIFPFERKFYSRRDLATHRRKGDPDNRSYRGHPLCDFCDERFMDNDELLRHLRKTHFYCHFCDASNSKHEYFNEYEDLRVHFRAQHFLCEEGECGMEATRLTHAFATEIDFKAHVAAEHMGNKSKAQTRELRTIDVSFQVAPRRRGRATGVVAPEDFEEVGDSNRNPRDRRHRRYNNRYESSRNNTPTPPPEPEAPPAPEPPVLDDFPTLGNCPPPFVPAPQHKPAEVVEDFPSLSTNLPPRSVAATSASSLIPPSMRPAKPSISAASQKPLTTFSSAASVMTTSGTGRSGGAQSRPVERKRSAAQAATTSKQSWAASRLASGEDFPSLGSDKRSSSMGDGPNLVRLGGAWTNKQKNSSSRPPAKRDGRESPPFNPMTSLASLGRSLCDDGEFPSLGGRSSAPEPVTWVQKNVKPAKNKSGKPTPLGNTLKIATSKKPKEEEVFQWNGSLESRTDETKSKKKKKKQKEKEQERKKSTEDSGISLSSIAAEIDAVIPDESSSVKESSSALNGGQAVPASDQTASASSVVEGEPSDGEQWETVVNKKSVGFQEDDFPTLSAVPKRSIGKSSTEESEAEKNTKKNKSALTETAKTFQDDFPAFSAISARGNPASSPRELREKGNSKKDEGMKKMADDFPKLQAQMKQTRPPPGFAKAPATVPPPGLGACPSMNGKCPPGLSSTSSSSASSLSQPVIPMSVKLGLYTYVMPLDGKERNSALVSRVRKLLILKEGGFDQFRALSAEFRSGQMNAQTYHRRCQDLFGEEKFLEVLPELLALLPDILKQHELAVAHSQSILGICAPLSLMTCPTCQQYLKVEDSPLHFSSHANLGQDMAASEFAGAAALPLKTY